MNKRYIGLFCLFTIILCLFAIGASAQDEPLYPAQEGDLYGYINRAGEWVIPPKYYYADEFMPCGLAVVSKEVESVWDYAKTASLIDKTGATVKSFGDWKVKQTDPFDSGTSSPLDAVVERRENILLLKRNTQDVRHYALDFADTARRVEMDSSFLTAACPHPDDDWAQCDTSMELIDVWPDRILLTVSVSKRSLYGFILLDRQGNPVAHRWDAWNVSTSCMENGEYVLCRVGSTSSVVDKNGNDVVTNLSIYTRFQDGAVIDAEDCTAVTLPDGQEMELAAWQQMQADKSQWGAYPTDEGLCLDESRGLSPKLTQNHYASYSAFCAEGLAWALSEEEYSLDLMDINGTIRASRLQPYTQNDSYLPDLPAFFDGWMCVQQMSSDTEEETIRSDYGYISPEGKFLLDSQPFSTAQEFKNGLAYVGVTGKDFTLVNAYVDPTGHVVWAENDREAELQELLDTQSIPKMDDMTAEDATRILMGEWDCSGGGEHLGYPVKFEDDGTWKVVPYNASRGDYWGEPPFELLFKDSETGEFAQEYGLGLFFTNGDTFGVQDFEGGSGYIRMPKGYWDDYK